MYITNEKDHEYRHGDNGPKYLMMGPKVNFGICRLLPHQVYAPHKHMIMEEDFYVLEGQLLFIVDGKPYHAVPGDFIHLSPGEVHKIENPTDEPVIYTIITAPFIDGGDRVDVPES